MILRRFMQHFKEQNWFAVGLDIIVVIVGIFLGMQVQQWYEERQLSEQSNTYIERLRIELAINRSDVEERKVYFTQVREHAIRAITGLQSREYESSEQLLIDIYQASQVVRRALGRDTYNEILSVGSLNDEDEQELRKRLANFYRSISALLQNLQEYSPYRDIIRSIIPHDIQTAIRASCDDLNHASTGGYGEPILMLPKSCELNLSKAQVENAIELVQQENIIKPLTRRISQLDTTLSTIDVLLNRIALLDDYLSKYQ